MSNSSKDNTSIRVHAPPGGPSNNIFATSEFEQSAANKKKHMGSDIFGSNQDHVEPAPVKQTHHAGNNIFGANSQDTGPKPSTMAGQYKQTQMKSNIFGTDEPVSTRQVSDKNKSNIFGVDDTNKRQTNTGRRDPNASRSGYNPINGESYGVNEKKQETSAKTSEESNGNAHETAAAGISSTTTNPTENDNTQALPTENNNVKAPTTETINNQKVDNAQKNVHTSVRVFHPPGGKSNGPLW